MPSTPTAVETGPSFGSILRQPLAVGQRMGLPAGARQHDVALGKAGIVRGDHLAHRAAFHHAADRHRRRIGRPVAHAPAHIGIERQPDGAQQHLALAGRRRRVFLDAEVGRLGLADGARDENDAFGLGHGCFLRFLFVRHCEERKRVRPSAGPMINSATKQSDLASLRSRWIASLALAMTVCRFKP